MEATGPVIHKDDKPLDKGLSIRRYVLCGAQLLEGLSATVKTIETLGQQHYSQFIEVERLFHCEKPLTDAITKNKLSLFSTAPTKSPSKGKLQLDSLKSDCNLFYRLYVTCQNRDGDLDRFFAHENSSTPPSLSQGGMLRTANKAELLTCLESGVDITSVNKYP